MFEKKLFQFAELGFTLFALVIYAGGTGGILTLLLSGGAGETDITVDYDTSLSKICYVFIYITTFLLLAIRWKKVFYVLSKDRFISLILGLCLLSVFWSYQSGVTIKYFFNLLGSSLFGLYFTSRYTLKQQLNVLGWFCIISVFLSFFFVFILPHYGVMGGVHAGKWRGIFLHKNGLGKYMSLSSIIFLLLAFSNKKYLYPLLLVLTLGIILLLLSQSTSSFLILIEMIAILIFLYTLKWKLEILTPTLLLIILVAAIIFSLVLTNSDIFLISLGKDTSLTGRTPLWEAVWSSILEHPWLGYGYEGFWKGWDTECAKVWYVVGWTPTHPHNGLLGLWLDLGLLGVSIYVIGICRSLFRALIYLRSSKTSYGLWPMAYLIWIILNNISETNMITFNDLTWILFVSINLSLQMPFQDILEEPRPRSDTPYPKVS